ncbi:MAG: tyrosine-type recombinase/integrase [Desulfobacterales bacterium]
MNLTDVAVKGIKPGTRTFRLADGRGLNLEVTPQGSKLWRYRYRFKGKQKTFAIGVYPDVSLADARDEHQKARKQVAAGIDPSAARRVEKRKRVNTFGEVALEWWKNQKGKWTPVHAQSIWRRLEINALPWLGNRPVEEIHTGELLKALRRIESRNAIDTAKRVSNYFRNIFIYAVAAGYTTHNPASDLTKALKVVPSRNMPAITEPNRIKDLLLAIEGFRGTFIVKAALSLAPLVFVRPGELRKAEWQEFDLESSLWTVPAEKMKMKRDHIVPLSRQAVEILQELEPLTGPDGYVFPSVRTKTRPMSENTLNVAIRRLGYSKDEMVPHGFRTMASTRLHEMGWKSEIVEFQLAHADKNKVRGIYNRAEYLEERKRMMQAWADYLDSLRKEEKIIPIRRTKK